MRLSKAFLAFAESLPTSTTLADRYQIVVTLLSRSQFKSEQPYTILKKFVHAQNWPGYVYKP